MITKGLSHHEISLITKILEEYDVDFKVDAAGGSDEVKIRGGRGDASFYQIEIPSEQFEKLPATAKTKLENLGIYPEMEAPDFSEESPKVKSEVDVIKTRKSMKNFERVFILVMIVMAVSFVIRVIRNQ